MRLRSKERWLRALYQSGFKIFISKVKSSAKWRNFFYVIPLSTVKKATTSSIRNENSVEGKSLNCKAIADTRLGVKEANDTIQLPTKNIYTEFQIECVALNVA